MVLRLGLRLGELGVLCWCIISNHHPVRQEYGQVSVGIAPLFVFKIHMVKTISLMTCNICHNIIPRAGKR